MIGSDAYQIGINLTDDQYSGLYHGTQRHPSDVYEVVERAKSVECRKLIVTGSDVESSRRAIGLSKVFRTSDTLPVHTDSAFTKGVRAGREHKLIRNSGHGLCNPRNPPLLLCTIRRSHERLRDNTTAPYPRA